MHADALISQIAWAPGTPDEVRQAVKLGIRRLDGRANGNRREIGELAMHGELKIAIEKAGGVRALARAVGISYQYVDKVLQGHKPVPPSMLSHMGWQRITRTSYRQA